MTNTPTFTTTPVRVRVFVAWMLSVLVAVLFVPAAEAQPVEAGAVAASTSTPAEVTIPVGLVAAAIVLLIVVIAGAVLAERRLSPLR